MIDLLFRLGALDRETFNGQHSEGNANDEEEVEANANTAIEIILPTPEIAQQEEDDGGNGEVSRKPDHVSSLV
jgi:hypothetical protein